MKIHFRNKLGEEGGKAFSPQLSHSYVTYFHHGLSISEGKERRKDLLFFSQANRRNKKKVYKLYSEDNHALCCI